MPNQLNLGEEVEHVTEIGLFLQIEVLSAEINCFSRISERHSNHRNTFWRIYDRIIADIIRQNHYTVVH